MSEKIREILLEYSERFNQQLPKFFVTPLGPEKRVIEAMHYSMSNGGKRLRPFLVFETAKLFGVSFAQSVNAATALEMVHTYSLIHDDLPCMDNDDLRRGKPTCHKRFDEATAVLAGDGLLTYAFYVLASDKSVDAETCRKLTGLLSDAAGAFGGMVAGQMLDLTPAYDIPVAEKENTVKRIEEMKTGRMIMYAVEAGAVLGGATPKQLKALQTYARKTGQAFQIADDILDVEGDQELVGKTLNKDGAQGKMTFVGLYGVEKASKLAHKLTEEAKEAIADFGSKAENLRLLADYFISRKS